MKYDVYGIGNALVDKEFEIEDDFLKEFSIEKGMMTLVDREQQDQLLSELTRRYGVKTLGGGFAYTLYAISQFGGSASTRAESPMMKRAIFPAAAGGPQHTDQQKQSAVEGVAKMHRDGDPDAERTMHTYLGVFDNISISEMNFEAALNCEYMYLEGYLVTSDTARSAIIEMKDFAKSNGIKTAMTFSDPSMLEYFKDNVNEVLGDGVDLLLQPPGSAVMVGRSRSG